MTYYGSDIQWGWRKEENQNQKGIDQWEKKEGMNSLEIFTTI